VAKWILRLIAFTYLAFLLVIPVGIITRRTFENGAGPVWDSLTTHEAIHAFQITIFIAVCVVVMNTIFGVGAAIGVPRVFTERDPQARLRMLEEGLRRWRMAQPLYGLGPFITSVGVGYLAADGPAGWTRALFVGACSALGIGAAAWSWSLYLRGTRISDFALGGLPSWPFTTYVLLTICSLALLASAW